MNFNATVFKLLNLAGIEVIVHDWRGEVIGALSMPIPLTQTVNELEALASRRAVRFASELGLRKVIFEGDLSMVINALSQGSGCFSSYVNIIDDIIFLVADFQFFEFYHFFFSDETIMLKYFVMLWLMFLLKRPKTCWGFGFGWKTFLKTFLPLSF